MQTNKITKYQKFEAVTINRKDIKNAPYNPRKIGEKESKALRKSIKTHGLVDTLIFNEVTGNLVGGHQRLSQLDALEGNEDYELTMAKINVSEKQEKEINIALNNPNMQGEYNFDMLKDLFLEIDIENTGFSDYDLSIFGVDSDLEEIKKTEKSKEEMEESIRKVKEAKQRSLDKNIGTGEKYIVVTFTSTEAKESFLDFLGHEPDDRYIKGEILLKYIEKKPEGEILGLNGEKL